MPADPVTREAVERYRDMFRPSSEVYPGQKLSLEGELNYVAYLGERALAIVPKLLDALSSPTGEGRDQDRREELAEALFLHDKASGVFKKIGGVPAELARWGNGCGTQIGLVEANRYRARIDAILALSPAPQPAAGWQLVPVEPTRKMLTALNTNALGYSMGFGAPALRSMYYGLLAAAPKPPASPSNPTTTGQGEEPA